MIDPVLLHLKYQPDGPFLPVKLRQNSLGVWRCDVVFENNEQLWIFAVFARVAQKCIVDIFHFPKCPGDPSPVEFRLDLNRPLEIILPEQWCTDSPIRECTYPDGMGHHLTVPTIPKRNATHTCMDCGTPGLINFYTGEKGTVLCPDCMEKWKASGRAKETVPAAPAITQGIDLVATPFTGLTT